MMLHELLYEGAIKSNLYGFVSEKFVNYDSYLMEIKHQRPSLLRGHLQRYNGL